MHRNSAIAFSDFNVDTSQPAAENRWPSFSAENQNSRLDHFVCREGEVYAGTHLILDLWGAKQLDELGLMERSLRRCVAEAEATLLHIHLHHFTPNGGISGVAVLAESHISVHTWPERDYAAFDVFMCGETKPERCQPVLTAAFRPERIKVHKHLRGGVETPI
ncbi:MAG: adenosylmethionine decarboxylase [Gammaproteobacteria bacterium]|nr:adenosylmethionine decarboxylase [Gammaproteobacteria bacterium]